MGFFYNATRSTVKKAASSRKHIPIETMQQMGCKACPLDKAKLTSPKMQPVGTDSPLIYILGEAPGENEDLEGEPFVGKSGKLLRSQIPANVLRREVRIGNTIRCRPPENRTPETTEIECCRRQVAQDIGETKPSVIVGAGNIPLTWATGFSSVTSWRGRLIAVRFGGHECWYYPILHPSYVLRNQKKYGKSEYEIAFEHDLAWIADNADRLPPAKVYDAPYDTGLTLIEGNSLADFHQLEDLLNQLAREPDVAIDLETSGLRPYGKDSAIYLCSVATFDYGLSFPLDFPNTWNSRLKPKVWGLLADFLLGSGRKIAHHLGFELEWLCYFFGKELAGLTEWEDTLAAAHTINEKVGTNSLGDLTRQYFGFNLKEQSRVEPKNLLHYPIRDGLRYNGMDSKWTHLLHHTLQPIIRGNAKLEWEYERKVRLEPALVLTQLKGVQVDFDYAEEMEAKLSKEVSQIERQIKHCKEVSKYEAQFGSFNPGSPDHVLKLMKDVCNRDEVKKPEGGYTSDEGALGKIPGREVPSAPLILELRATTKLLGTYVTPIIKRTYIGQDGLIHTKYSSMIAVTGRLASEDPNIQNFPKRKHKEIRGMIVPPPGYWLTAIDYGQIEARVIAMASEDRELVKALWTGYDIHGFWADRFMEEYPRIKDRIITDYKVDGDDLKLIRKKFRDEIKNGWVFPQFFGASLFSCAANLKVPEIVAQDLGKEFWDQFSGVQRWQKKLIAGFEKNLYVETLTGRRRRGPQSKNELINAPIQGTAADIVTGAMTELSEVAVAEDNDDFQPNINVHDDLTFYLPDQTLEASLARIAPIMCRHRFDFINVPLIVEVSVAERWNELEEIAVYRSNELFRLRNPYG